MENLESVQLPPTINRNKPPHEAKCYTPQSTYLKEPPVQVDDLENNLLSEYPVAKPEIISRYGENGWSTETAKEQAETEERMKQYEYKEELGTVLSHVVIHHTAYGNAPGPDYTRKKHLKRGFDDIGYHFMIGPMRDKKGRVKKENGKVQYTIYALRSISQIGAHAGQSEEANTAAKQARQHLNPSKEEQEKGLEPLDENEVQQLLYEAWKKDPDFGAVGVVMDGAFDNSKPSEEMLQKLDELVSWLKVEYDIPTQNIIGHTDVEDEITGKRGCHMAGNATICPGHHGEKAVRKFKKGLPKDTDEARKKIL